MGILDRINSPAASPAIPEIKKHAAEGPFQGRAMIALAVLGTNSIPALVSLCEHTNAEVRVEAALVLAKLNVGMRGLRSFMAQSPFSGQPMLAYNIDTGVEDTEALVQNLQHPELAVRRATVEALGSSAKMVDRASPMLKQCLTNSGSAIRETSARILKGVRSSPPVQQ